MLWYLFLYIYVVFGEIIEIENENYKIIDKQLSITILFYHPQCKHSQIYARQYYAYKINQKRAIVNCKKQPTICTRYNISLYPILIKVIEGKVQIINQQHYLEQGSLLEEDISLKIDEDKLKTNKLLELLKNGSYAVIVLQQQGLQIPNRLNDNKILYLQPNRLSKAILSIVGGNYGCWILHYKNSSILQKYSCGSGLFPLHISDKIKQYQQGKLSNYLTSSSSNNNHLSTYNFNLYLQQQKSIIVYFYSNLCTYYDLQDLKAISRILQNLSLHVKIYSFSIDFNELPHQVKINRVPELIYWYQSKPYVFSKIFTMLQLNKFFREIHFKTQPQEL